MDWQSITDTCGLLLWVFGFLVLAVMGVKKSERKHGFWFPSKELSSGDLKVLGLAGLSFLVGFVLFAVGTFAFSTT